MSCENLRPPGSAGLAASAEPSPLVLPLALVSAFLLAPFSTSRVFLRAALDRVRPGWGMSMSSGIRPPGSCPPGSWGKYWAAARGVRLNAGRISGISTGKSHSAAINSTPARLRPPHRMTRDMMSLPLARRNLATRSMYCFSPCVP